MKIFALSMVGLASLLMATVPNSFQPGTTISSAAVNANFSYLDSVTRAQANQISALTASLQSLQSKESSDSLAARAKIRSDSSAQAAFTLVNLPKGSVIGLLTAPGADGYLAGTNSTWILAAGQGSVNGVTVPDLRARFLRGIDYTLTGAPANGADPDGVRTVGSAQADLLKAHDHNITNWGLIGKAPAGVWSTYNDATVSLLQPGDGRVATSGRIAESFPQVMPSIGGAETRPKNVAVYWYVKVK